MYCDQYLFTQYIYVEQALDICREFDLGDDSKAQRKSTKKQTKIKIFYCNLENKNLFIHLRHYCTISSLITSARLTLIPTRTQAK